MNVKLNKRRLSFDSILEEKNLNKKSEDNSKLRILLNKVVEKNENLSKENEKLNFNLNSLLKLLKDKDSKLKIINKNNDLLSKYSNLNYLRIKIYNILKKYFANRKEKEELLIKIHFLLWKDAIPCKFSNLSFNYNNYFSIKNSQIKIKKALAFDNSDLKISTCNDNKESNQQLSYYASRNLKDLLTDSFSNTESNIGLISSLDRHKYLMLIVFKIFECSEIRIKMHFMKNLILLFEQIRNEDQLSYRLNEIENSRTKQNLEIRNNQEEELDLINPENKTNNGKNINQNLDKDNMNNLLDYIREEYEIEKSNNFQIESLENIHNTENNKINNGFKFKYALEKIIFILNSYRKGLELNLKYSFWIGFIKAANYNVIHDKILILSYKLKFEKLIKIIKRSEKNFVKSYFKKFARRAFLMKEQEEKEELEFFQNTNYSLIMLSLLERIFIKKLSETEMQQRFFSNLKLIYIQANYHELSNRLTDLDNSNWNSEHANKKNLVLNRLLFSKYLSTNIKNFLRTYFYRWKNINLKSTTVEQSSILNSLPNLEEEFTDRINEIELKYRKIMEKNKAEFDLRVSEKNNEIKENKTEIQNLSNSLTQLQESFENEKNYIVSSYEKKLKEKELYISNLDQKARALDKENTDLLQKLGSFKLIQNDLENENKKYYEIAKELEEKANNFEAELKDLKALYEEKSSKYENLRNMSKQSTQELINNNNEFSKLQSENKNLAEKLEKVTEKLDKLTNESNKKENLIRQLKLNEENLIQQLEAEKENFENKHSYEKKTLIDKIEYLESEAYQNIEELRRIKKENSSLNDKLRYFSDYDAIKNAYNTMQEKFVKYEEENIFLKNQNTNLQKQADNLIHSLATETNKGDEYRIELDELRELTKESKEDLAKALDEMDEYNNIIIAMEEKIRMADEEKLNAQKERDQALNDVKIIRQRYINIIDGQNFQI